jgi:TRAP-type C4-dicarboxylate transport system substrate-binding protein
MEVYYPTAEELQSFRAATQSVVEFVADKAGQDIVDKLVAAAAEANKKYEQ